MNDLWEAIKVYAKQYRDNDAYLAYDVNAKTVSVWKEGYEHICYYKVNLEQLLDLGYDNEVLAKMVFMNFMNAKELFDENRNN